MILAGILIGCHINSIRPSSIEGKYGAWFLNFEPTASLLFDLIVYSQVLLGYLNFCEWHVCRRAWDWFIRRRDAYNVVAICFRCKNEQHFPSFDAVNALSPTSPCPKCGAEWIKPALESAYQDGELMRLESKP
jgi:hypothetical protein